MKMLGLLRGHKYSNEQKLPDRPFDNLSFFGSPKEPDHKDRDRLIVELTPKEQPLPNKINLDGDSDCACE